MSDKAVLRFAPSPTGFLHLGSARTALINWVYARHLGGKLLLRIEDTDLKRSSKEFLEEILRDLRWLGIDWDEEPIYQSTRFDLYRSKAEQVLASGGAYKEGDAIIYRVEDGRDVEVEDLIHGRINFNTDQIKDQVLIKSDGSPAYNFCCVVDDAEMGITHVIRGDDHISNTPKQMLLYEAIGAEAPAFAHMPLMMGPDGAKLSKRHGAVAVEEYKSQGYLPEALVNYLLLLGWSPEGEEIFSIDEAVSMFDISDMRDVQVRFDHKKLTWINSEHIKKRAPEQLRPLIECKLKEAGLDSSVIGEERLVRLIELYMPRVRTLNDLPRLAECFFTDEYSVDEKGKKKYLCQSGQKELLGAFADIIEGLEDFSEQALEEACRSLAEERGVKAAAIIHPARMAASGKTMGAGLFEMLALLGRAKVVTRLRKAASA